MPNYETLQRIYHEVVLDLPPARPDTPEEAEARRSMERDKAEADRKGWMLQLPTEP